MTAQRSETMFSSHTNRPGTISVVFKAPAGVDLIDWFIGAVGDNRRERRKAASVARKAKHRQR